MDVYYGNQETNDANSLGKLPTEYMMHSSQCHIAVVDLYKRRIPRESIHAWHIFDYYAFFFFCSTTCPFLNINATITKYNMNFHPTRSRYNTHHTPRRIIGWNLNYTMQVLHIFRVFVSKCGINMGFLLFIGIIKSNTIAMSTLTSLKRDNNKRAKKNILDIAWKNNKARFLFRR